MKKPYIDDSEFTEIIIQPDGRIYVFGMTPQVSDALNVVRASAEGTPTSETPVQTHVQAYTETEVPHGEG